MNIRSELRIAWFVEAYLKNPGAGLHILGTGAGHMGCLEQMAKDGRFNYTPLESLCELQQCEATPIYWNMVKDNSHDVAIGWYALANEQILELVLHQMAHTVKPGGYICLAISQTAHGTSPAASAASNEQWLVSLALRNNLTPLHASLNLAPLGADPAWYEDGATDLMLVAKKPTNWEDSPPDSTTVCSTIATKALYEEFVPKAMQPWATEQTAPKLSIPGSPAGRINFLAGHYQAASYLELSAQPGTIFPKVQCAVKVQACPMAQNLPHPAQQGDSIIVPLNTENFFTQLGIPGSALRTALGSKVPSLRFDIIFINADHTFTRSLRDFTNSLAYAHANTLFVLNSSVPCDPYSALPDRKQALAYRHAAGFQSNDWHGEVFKTVFAIHDLFPQYSYCTLTEKSSQTFIWRAATQTRTALFPSLEHISKLGYFDMLHHAAALMPVDPEMLPKLIGKTLNPCDYARPNTWKKLICA